MNFDNRDRILELSNENRESGINYSIKYTRWFLRFLGIWPLVISKSTRIEKIVSFFLLPLSSFSMIILVVPIFSHVIANYEDRLELLVLLGPIIFQVTNVLKHIVMILRANSIKLCIEHMRTDWQRIENTKDRNIMMKNLRNGQGLTIFCTFCMYSGALAYHTILPLWRGNTINKFNETVRPLAYPGSEKFVNLDTGIIYEIVFCTNCISAFFHFSVVTAVCNLAAIFVSHACGQIQIVISRLESLVDTEDNDDPNVYVIQDKIAFIIRYHVRVLRFSSRIDQVLREICLMEVGASTVIICMLEYYCITGWNDSEAVAMGTYIVLLISECFNIYIFCHIGELLKEQTYWFECAPTPLHITRDCCNECYLNDLTIFHKLHNSNMIYKNFTNILTNYKLSEVGKASSLIEWYRLPGKTGLGLVLVIAMANYPRKLTAGGMMELSILTFGNIMKTSLGYLNMIRTTAI